MNSLFKSSTGFSSLSLKDLLEARDRAHYGLMKKKNVVATAIGLYRIRKSDPWPDKDHPKGADVKKKSRRTLFNSEIRPYSWPCIYVFVSQWDSQESIAEEDYADLVPKAIDLEDGRSVPVCVIEAKPQDYSHDLKVELGKLTPRNFLSPGVAIVNEDAQGMTRIATVGCIVRDAERYYALTNRHALGSVGTEIKAVQTHRSPIVGITSDKLAGRVEFKQVYPSFSSSNQYLLVDIGLINLDNITLWKTEVPGIKPVQTVLDLFDNSFSLQLIGLKVVGQSAVTGLLRGEIHGLFYRYKAMGGMEYLSDFLIGPETRNPKLKDVEENWDRAFTVHHGDSGTLLFVEHHETVGAKKTTAPVYYPFALLWGRQEFLQDTSVQAQPFALATALSTAFSQLDLDLVRDLNIDQEYIWGWVGHYVIGGQLAFAVELLQSLHLKSFIDKNADSLAISPDDALGNDPRVLDQGATDDSDPHFVPLADVPDNVWKSNVNFYMVDGDDGKKKRMPGPGSRGQNDNPNHFADMDLPYETSDTFLEFCIANIDDRGIDPQVWVTYYNGYKSKFDAWDDALGKQRHAPFYSHWGALPFRIRQLYEAMVTAAKAKNQELFLLSGGVLIHYVGDACQPLHTSYLSQGDPDRVVPRAKGTSMKLEADGVHSGYEDDMVNFGYQKKGLDDALAAEIRRQQGDQAQAIRAIGDGADVVKAIIELVSATHATISPREIVDKWVECNSLKRGERTGTMWDTFGDRTVECMARGTRYLAAIWQAAWVQGNGEGNIGTGKELKPEKLMALYNDPTNIPSIRLDRYSQIFQ